MERGSLMNCTAMYERVEPLGHCLTTELCAPDSIVSAVEPILQGDDLLRTTQGGLF